MAPTLPLIPLQSNATDSADYSSLFAVFSDPDPIAAVVQPPPNIVLKGVLLAIPEVLSSALLDINGEVKNYRIGDDLKDSGYVLVAVAWNEIVIADATGKQTVIRMPEAMPLNPLIPKRDQTPKTTSKGFTRVDSPSAGMTTYPLKR